MVISGVTGMQIVEGTFLVGEMVRDWVLVWILEYNRSDIGYNREVHGVV